ncbi:amino acid ABC transporter substrate-binding protein [Methylobacterium sp. NMS14P]|uniref:amino acid ABC transporter substrate-binding protein n=1 Tax=Methylobacterium sp. NMS14P TaxID=2894310 RepID=UPI00235946B8|nr:amino acid ABC transporter substrate-binding protein [Methylobacterium sp. NMS14P]WCS25709.1 amino acid ABC transporter substrate-binding protein [Methylobacterium sp. NMS14P]
MRLLPALTLAVLVLTPFTPASADGLAGTLKQIKDRRAITIGVGDSSIPFSYIDRSNQTVGYAVDLCLFVAEAVKTRLNDSMIETKLVPIASAARIALLSNGTIDLHCSANTNNAERQKVLGFSDTIFLTASRFVSKNTKNLRRIADLRGRTVVSTAGSSNFKQLVEVNAKQGLNMTILTAKEHAEAFLMVESGRADAFVMDDILLASFVAGSKEPGAYTISSEAFAKPEPYAIMMRKGDPVFKALVDETLASIFKGPRIAELYDRWFTKPIPPHGINLDFPMGAALKRVFAQPSDSPDPDAY